MPRKNPRKKPVKKADKISVYCSHDAIIPTSKLRPNPDNPNTHPDKQIELLADIIRDNGWRDRITISNQSGMIVKGHGRYMAALRAGLKKVPVDYQDYKSYSDELADLIGDNKISEFSIVDEDAAKALIENLGDVDFDLSLAGFQIEELTGGLDSTNQKRKATGQNNNLSNETIDEIYAVYVECESEKQQQDLLTRLMGEGLSCRALIS